MQEDPVVLCVIPIRDFSVFAVLKCVKVGEVLMLGWGRRQGNATFFFLFFLFSVFFFFFFFLDNI